MSNNQIVIETLIAKLKTLKADQSNVWQKYEEQINEIEDALDQLAGKSVWRPEKKELYNDLDPNYICQSEDGI